VRQFCERQDYRASHTDHYYYDKVLADGSTSGTKISFGNDGEHVPPQYWIQVWKHQLRLMDEEQFWAGLEGAAVRYDIPPVPNTPAPLPVFLARFLRDVLHYSEEQIATTGRYAAQQLLNAHYARELNQPP
jgi:hypothetical protein